MNTELWKKIRKLVIIEKWEDLLTIRGSYRIFGSLLFYLQCKKCDEHETWLKEKLEALLPDGNLEVLSKETPEGEKVW